MIGSEGFLKTLCQHINERGKDGVPDFITIDSADGGAVAAPMSLIDNVGIPIKESLQLMVQTLKNTSCVSVLISVPAVN